MNAALFQRICEYHGLPRPVPEYRFAHPRRWRFDWAWLDVRPRLALEIEGGAWTIGRHVRGKGYLADLEKYNEAVLRGWRLLRCTPQDIESLRVFALLRRALE